MGTLGALPAPNRLSLREGRLSAPHAKALPPPPPARSAMGSMMSALTTFSMELG